MIEIIKARSIVLVIAMFWLVVAGLLALLVWPLVPGTFTGWAAFIAFGPPLYFLGEAVSSWFWSSRVGRAISEHPSAVMRIFLGVMLGVLPIVLVILISALFGGP